MRAEQRLRRKQINLAERLRKSGEIASRLTCLKQFQEALSVQIYFSVQEEVSTFSLMETAQRLNKRVVIPVVDSGKNKLIFSEFSPDRPETLENGPFLTMQPKLEFLKLIKAEEIDLWVIPGIAFDPLGNRLGQGGGYYDRVLSENKKPVVGLAFEVQVTERLPVESTDVPVDFIITESRTIYCREEARDSEKN